MDTAFRIRPAATADVEGVAELERTIENVPHWTVADYAAALDRTNRAVNPYAIGRCFFVAEAERRVVGFAVGRVAVLDAEVLAELETVAVAGAFRRAGVGRALCEAVIGWARERGAEQIELEVRSRSGGAIALYKSLGFAAIGARPNYYRDPVDDASLMRLMLQSE